METRLKEVFPQIPVSNIDEDYTLRMAGKRMIEVEIKKRLKKKKNNFWKLSLKL